jgi:CRISPR-associated endonuclease/helicase Cas3
MAVKLTLLGQSEKIASVDPYNMRSHLLYHQWRTVEALRRAPLVMNTYNTGTGKTRASLLQLFHLPRDGESHVLFIAPTNELLHQHFNDIREFVLEHELPYRVLEVNARLLRQLAEPDVVDRQGERLTRLLRNPLEYHEQLGIEPTDQRKLSLILVTNPDLFYYALYWQFALSDQRNLFQTFVTRFRYVVIDEFHYYNTKQMANFLLFMILSREFGYFTPGADEAPERQFCLLSATPDEQICRYLDLVFGTDGWVSVSPDNEPQEASVLDQAPVLAPLQLTIQAGTVNDFAQTSATTIRTWLQDQQDGALISGALWRVNQAYAALRGTIAETNMGRITGAQPMEERRKDQFKALILATPTVDIGYNFLKHEKARQNLDFVIFDARFHDEFIQRMGRAGRVLGKIQTNIPAWAIALMDEEAVASFAPLHGQELTRHEFTAFLTTHSTILQRDDFSAYLRAGGMVENVYPILRAREMFARSDEAVLERVFDAVKSVFAAETKWSYPKMLGYWSRFWKLERWLNKPNESRLPDNSQLMAEFLGWSMNQPIATKDVQENFTQLVGQKELRNSFRLWCEMQYALTRAHFSFRDNFSGPVAWVYDPQHLLSSATATEYDLIHVIENYLYESLAVEAFVQRTGEKPPPEALCVYLHGHREQRQRVTLHWRHLPKLLHDEWDETTFERAFAAGEPVALRGILLRAHEPLPDRMRAAIQSIHLIAFLTPTALVGPFLRILQPRGIYSRDLYVQVRNREVKYAAVLGANALLIAPLIRWAFGLHQRQTDTAMIL